MSIAHNPYCYYYRLVLYYCFTMWYAGEAAARRGAEIKSSVYNCYLCRCMVWFWWTDKKSKPFVLSGCGSRTMAKVA